MAKTTKPKVLIYDTTLRDGTQGEGISFTVSAKIRLAEKLDAFGVDYIEGGWPGSNPRDMAFFEALRGVTMKHAKIAAFGSTRRSGIAVEQDQQLQLLLDAQTPVVTIFGKTWLLHVLEVLRTTEQENLNMIEESVRYLRSNGREVIYDAEHFFDGYYDSPEYALATLDAAVRGGADCITLCDTNGGRMVNEIEQAVATVVKRFPSVRVGMHCHNDCGLGVAVSLAGVSAGATLVQGTMNGYGERNGNANLTTIIPNLALKMGYGLSCDGNMRQLRDLSLFTDELANLRSDPKAAFVGASAFAHKGGVHANAAAKVARSYEHIDPTLVGNRQRVLISDMSGRSSLIMKARELGVDIDEKSESMKGFLQELKELEFKGYEYEAADASFRLLLARWLDKHRSFFDLIGYRVMISCRNGVDHPTSEATVKIQIGDRVEHVVAESHGPVGAMDIALRQALSKAYPEIEKIRLSDFKVRILESKEGTAARIRVLIESTDGEQIWGTVGVSDNLVVASWEALKDSLEYGLLLHEERMLASQK
jgi:2-isopropylmalate synthase